MLQLLINGISMGAIYALAALGIVVIAKAVNVVNFAQGDNVMLSTYVAYTLTFMVGLPILPTYILTTIIMAGYGFLFDKIAYYPLRNKPPFAIILSTIGVSIFLKNIVRVIWNAQPKQYPGLFGETSINLGFVSLYPQHLLIIGVTIVLIAFQSFFFSKTFLGRKMMATAQDHDVASLMGINVSRMNAITFMYSSMLASVAGVLVAPVFYVQAGMGSTLGLKAFAASIIGGFGSIPGAVVGGLLLGIFEIFGTAFISSLYKDAYAFIVLMIVLAVAPHGIFGEKISIKV